MTPHLDAFRYMTTFDNKSTGFGMSFDDEENPTTQFCKRYRASIIQTKQEMVEMQDLAAMSPALLDLAHASAIYQERHPVVDIKMTNRSLELLIKDFNDLTEMQQFLRSTPNAMDEFMKWKHWEALKR